MIDHSAIIDEDLNVWVCGMNDYGQLGLGDFDDRNILTKIENLPPVKSTSKWCTYTLFLDVQGYVWISGYFYGRDKVNMPTKMNDAENISKIASGAGHCILLDYEGNVFSFGSNDKGQLGFDNNNINSLRKIENIPKIKDICCGSSYTMLLDFEGNLLVFGNGFDGQLGLGDRRHRSVPTKIENLPPIRSFSAGDDSSFFVDLNNNVYSCGCNFDFQLGFSVVKSKLTPTKLPFLLNKEIEIKSVHCGGNFTFLLDINNNLWVFGNNYYGQLGLGLSLNGLICDITKLPFEDEVHSVALSYDNSLIITTNGDCYIMGRNSCGKLCLGHTDNVNVPTKIPNLKALTLNDGRFSKTKNARN